MSNCDEVFTQEAGLVCRKTIEIIKLKEEVEDLKLENKILIAGLKNFINKHEDLKSIVKSKYEEIDQILILISKGTK